MRIFLLFLSTIYCCCFDVNAQSQYVIAQEFIEIPYAAKGKQIDASLADWEAAGFLPFYISTTQKIVKDSARVSLAWDEHFLYFALRSYDQNLIKLEEGNKNENLWRNDGAELYIDSKFDSDSTMNLDDFNCIIDLKGDYTFYTVTQERIDNPLITVPKTPNRVVYYFEQATHYFGTLNDTSDIDDGYILEVKIPWTPLGVLPKAGDSMRLEIGVNDLDTLAGPDAWRSYIILPNRFYYTSWTGSYDWGIPNTWKNVKLVGQPDLITKWGREYPISIIGGSFGALLLLLGGLLFLRVRYSKLKTIHDKSKIQNQALLQLIEQQRQPEKSKMLSSSRSTNIPIFEKAKRILEERMDENIRPADLAAQLHISLRHFQRICKEDLETTPSTFITLYKIEKAAELLRSSDKNVTEVAFAVGFTDPSYFSKVFKRYFKQTPREYARVEE